MKSFIDDLRYGFRLLWASPGYAAVAILTLAVGIAVSLAVFAWVDGMLIHPLPGASDQQRLAAFENSQPNGEFQASSYRDFRDYRDNMKTISGLTASMQAIYNLTQPQGTGSGDAQSVRRIWGEAVSGNYFDVLGVKPFRGRFFSRDEQRDTKGSAPVAVISHSIWRTEFSSDPGILGKQIRLNSQPITVIGVAPPEFQGVTTGAAFEMWVPITMAPQMNLANDTALEERGSRSLVVIARLKAGSTIAQANSEAHSLARQIAAAYPNSNRGIGARVMRITEGHSGGSQLLDRPLRILMAMCLVLLLLVCANVANLQLARSASRLRELNVRLALGAGRVRLIRQQLTESILLATLSGLASIPMAMWLSPALTYLIPPANVPIRFGDLRITPLILAFIITICALSALISGIVPAVASTRLNVNEFLKEGGRSGSAGARSHRLQAILVIVEVTLAVVALAGAGIFVKSYSKAMAIHPGFDARGVLVGHLYLRADGFNGEQGSQMSSRLRLQFQQTSGVQTAAFADQIPLGFSNAGPWNVLEVDGYQPPAGQQLTCDRAAVSPGYFSLLRIPLIEGRDFNDNDTRKASQVIIVNQTFAKRYLAGSSVVGRQVRVAGRPSTVIGVVGDSKIFSLGETSKPYFYRPYDQGYNSGSHLAFFVRTHGDPRNMAASLRRVPTAMDGRLAAFEAIPMIEYNGAAVLPQRLAASLLTFLALLSLLLAGVGLYGVLACSVSERIREIGIRMALGAKPLNVVKMVFRRALLLTGLGAAIGTVLALLAGRVATGFLYGVSPADPAVYILAAVFLTLVAAPASYLPARRALRADPMDTLRSQ